MSTPRTSAEIREAYLSFFEEKGCQRIASSSLVPDDPSLLLTVAGMVQFKPYFLQQKHLDSHYIGATTAQKCVRTNDIDIIGTDGHHLSFFEMLGNFSFGDYFKEEMCAWAYEFSVDVLGLDPERIYITVFTDDDETAEIWEKIGIPPERISRMGEDENFWMAGPTGPCGPCSELYYDRGPEYGCGSPDCAPGCDCDRYSEYWNLVFTQYDAQEDGTRVPLEKKNIDTGMGLERVAAIQQDVQSNFDTDILRALIAVGEKLTGKEYGSSDSLDLALRIMADHSRSIAFMIGDGILPSNEGRGYVLRRLLRRAVRHAFIQGVDKPFLSEYLAVIIDMMGEDYPELIENRSLIEKTMLVEEKRFHQTIQNGEGFLSEALEDLHEGDTLDGVKAFTLHDTFGFPLELTEEICAERGISVDEEGFEREMEAQRNRARAARDDAAWEGIGDVYTRILDEHGQTDFVGYRDTTAAAQVLALVVDGASVQEAAAGTQVGIVLDTTPFYGEMGGQIGDVGTIEADGCSVAVTDATRPEEGLIVHIGQVEEGAISVGQSVTASIDTLRRDRIARNHTATHILQKALSMVLGSHVKQAGSLVSYDRLRFDFTHFDPMTGEEIEEVERICNETIMKNLPVRTYETSLTVARENGVLALFGEKYGEFVRVVEVGDYSKELCGGTHVGATGEIGLLEIVQESSIGANTRRIEAVTSFDAYDRIANWEHELREIARFLNCPPTDAAARVRGLHERLDDLEGMHKRRMKAVQAGSAEDYIEQALDCGGYQAAIVDADEAVIEGLREVWDIIKSRAGAEPFAAVLFARNPESDGAPLMLAAGTDAAVDAGFDAGAVVKEVAGHLKGGGGGRPNMAQAGGKDAAGIPAAIEATRAFLGA